jgi:hypothetical protein
MSKGKEGTAGARMFRAGQPVVLSLYGVVKNAGRRGREHRRMRVVGFSRRFDGVWVRPDGCRESTRYCLHAAYLAPAGEA